MGNRDHQVRPAGLPLAVKGGSHSAVVLTPEQIAKMDQQSRRIDELSAPFIVNGKFVEPEDDPDGFDRRMTGV